jgi:hypothetical protein
LRARKKASAEGASLLSVVLSFRYEFIAEKGASKPAPRLFVVREQAFQSLRDTGEVLNGLSERLEARYKRLPAGWRIEVGREGRHRAAFGIEVPVRIASRREQLHRAPACRSQLVLPDLYPLTREQAERNFDLDLLAGGQSRLQRLEKSALGRVLHVARIERGCRRVKALTRDCERGCRTDER